MDAVHVVVNRTVTAIICVSCTCCFFYSHSGDAEGLSVNNEKSALLKFSDINQVEHYIQVAHLWYQG